MTGLSRLNSGSDNYLYPIETYKALQGVEFDDLQHCRACTQAKYIRSDPTLNENLNLPIFEKTLTYM
ncbi:MAG: hypothetical protein ACRBBN_02915 [Methyloligellaceae bacterium]